MAKGTSADGLRTVLKGRDYWEWLLSQPPAFQQFMARRAAARALIASTSPALRWLILREGFVPFQLASKHFFDTDDLRTILPLQIDSTTMRWVFEYLMRYTRTKGEQLKWPKFQAMYEKQRLKNPTPPTEDDDGPVDVKVESVYDGHLKRQELKDATARVE